METLDVNQEQFKTRTECMQTTVQNRIINTDTYNRTMDQLRGPEGWREQETYVLQMRRSPFNYHVIAGVEDAVRELTDTPITQEEIDTAAEFYDANNLVFNRPMWQEVVDKHDGYLPIEVHAVPDGTVTLPSDPILRVTGPGELIAHFEHVFHRPFYDTLVATRAHEINRIVVDPKRFIEVGKRGTPDEETHLRALKAMAIGGDFTLTSNDAGAAVFDELQAVGTIGHRYVQRFPDEEAAFRHAIENLDAVSLLVDLVDTYDGLDLALKLKNEYRGTGKQIWTRLDSGDLMAQQRYYLDGCDENGFTDPVLDRVVIEGMDTLEELTEIEKAIKNDSHRARVSYGAGGLLVAQQVARSDASTGFKLAEYEENEVMVPTMKFSNSPGKQSLPGKPTLVETENGRVIAQAGEVEGFDMLQPIYSFGQQRKITTIGAAQARRSEQFTQMADAIKNNERTAKSAETILKIGEVMCRYSLK